MTGTANLFSRFGFQVGADGKLDNYTRAFFSRFAGRIGPPSPISMRALSWAQIAATPNGLIKRVRGARLGSKGLRRGRDGLRQRDPGRDHDPGGDRMGLCAL